MPNPCRGEIFQGDLNSTLAMIDPVLKEFRHSIDTLAEALNSMFQASSLLRYGREWDSVVTDVKSKLEATLSDPTGSIPEFIPESRLSDEDEEAMHQLSQALGAASESCVRLQLVYEKLLRSRPNASENHSLE